MQRPLPDAVSAVLSGTGFGLLLWLGISVALVPPGAGMAALRAPQMWSLILALALLCVAAAIAVSASAAPRSVRSLLHAPTRWHLRRNALASSAAALALAVGGLLSWAPSGAPRALALGLVGMLLSLTSLGVVVANAVARPSAASSAVPHPLIVPVQVLTALSTGLALMFALLAGLLAVGPGGGRMLIILLVLGVLAAATSALYWRDARAGGNGRPAARDFRASSLATPALLAAVPALAWAMSAAEVGGSTLWLWVISVASFTAAVVDRHAFLTHAAAPDRPT
ncbi:hypothetical protein [Luteimonas saliphila]|uniref:hypothetical protein n=1 Tax=Luteimonas saliphila TaxID=2804919 RepID=UPI00192D2AD8|nr:hypothetical protein [Luteimonas saliphila]